MKLYYPCKPYILTQKFGANNACVEVRNDIPRDKRKVIGTIDGTCHVGYTSLYADLGLTGHSGADLAASHGTPIYHAGPDGFVEEVQTEPERGLGLGIITNEKQAYDDTAYQMKLRYWHLLDFTVKKGDQVKTGQLIGHADNTGYSSGDHLHFECKPVQLNTRTKLYQNVFQNNGMNGGIDPEPYFCGEYADSLNKFPFIFKNTMKFGSESEDVGQLQKALKSLGYFPERQQITNFYGFITASAVYEFQLRQGLLSWWEKLYLKSTYSVCGPKTIARLNHILQS